MPGPAVAWSIVPSAAAGTVLSGGARYSADSAASSFWNGGGRGRRRLDAEEMRPSLISVLLLCSFH